MSTCQHVDSSYLQIEIIGDFSFFSLINFLQNTTFKKMTLSKKYSLIPLLLARSEAHLHGSVSAGAGQECRV